MSIYVGNLSYQVTEEYLSQHKKSSLTSMKESLEIKYNPGIELFSQSVTRQVSSPQ